MPPGLPSRRSLLQTAASALAWLSGAHAAKAATPPAAPPQTPKIIRVADTPPAPPEPLSRAVTYHSSADGEMTYSSHGDRTTYVYDDRARLVACRREGHVNTVFYGARTLPAPGQPRTAHASCRLETPGGEPVGREEYEVVVEGGKRLVRVRTLGPDGAVVKTEDLSF